MYHTTIIYTTATDTSDRLPRREHAMTHVSRRKITKFGALRLVTKRLGLATNRHGKTKYVRVTRLDVERI